MTVVGARPQFIKAATISREIAKRDSVEEIIVHTGQHFEQNMSDVFFEELAIPKPHYNLGIHGGMHGRMTGRMLEAIEKVIIREKPDIVLVFGDTNSTLAGALAAAKLYVPVAHVEAGLRSFNRRMPEEINRLLTDHASDLLFCPTEIARRNLTNEGFSPVSIHQVGDVMFDAALFYRELAREPDWFEGLGLKPNAFYLATLHRAENTDDSERLQRILSALNTVAQPVVFPVHPRTKEELKKYDVSIGTNVIVVEPVSFLEMGWLESNCIAVATDSGGVQKEAFFHEKHCVILRDETEWFELVDAGAATLVGSDARKIEYALKAGPRQFFTSSRLFGDGQAGSKILDVIDGGLIAC